MKRFLPWFIVLLATFVFVACTLPPSQPGPATQPTTQPDTQPTTGPTTEPTTAPVVDPVVPPPVPAPDPVVVTPFLKFDWLGYHEQPDLRPSGWIPIWGIMDGTYNRALVPEGDRIPGNGDPALSLQAAIRQAKAAAGVDPLGQNMWNRPPAYANVPQHMVFDLEDENFMRRLDMERGTDAERIETLRILCEHYDAMKAEAKSHGHDVKIGSYCPMGPLARYLHPRDERRPALFAAALQQSRAWMDRQDFLAPDFSMMHADVEACKADATRAIGEIRELFPNTPIYAEMQLCYAHYAPAEMQWKTPPLADWINYVSYIVNHPEIDGIVLFGQAVVDPGVVNVGNPANGTQQTPYGHIAQRVSWVDRIVNLKNTKRPNYRPKR